MPEPIQNNMNGHKRPIFIVLGPVDKVEQEPDDIMNDNETDTFKFSEISFETVRKSQADFAEERNWNQFHTPRNLLLAMVGEVGELAELFQWRGEVKEKLPDWSEDEKEHLGEELSDVLLYLIRLSDKCGVDLPAAALKKISKNANKYPPTLTYGSSKKYTEYKEKNGKLVTSLTSLTDSEK